MPVVGGTSTVGAVDTKKTGLPAALVGSLATALNIPKAEAKKLITAYHSQHGGSWESAMVGAYNTNGASAPTTTPGGGSSGSSGSSGPSPATIANASASYANMLASWGIPITRRLKQLISQAVMGGGSASFLQALRRTPEYRRRFAGILKPDGTMRMTEAQYIAGFASANDYASTVGRELTPGAYALAIQNGNSASEIKQKIQALDTLRSNAAMFKEFSDYLVARGVVKQPLQKADLLKFTMGQAPPQWEKEWQDAYAAYQLSTADINVGRPKEGADLGYKELDHLINQAEARGITPSSADYQQLAQQVREVLPLSALYKEGITKKDLAKLYFGAKGSDVIAAQVTRVLATHQAFATEVRAYPQLGTGGEKTQATE